MYSYIYIYIYTALPSTAALSVAPVRASPAPEMHLCSDGVICRRPLAHICIRIYIHCPTFHCCSFSGTCPCVTRPGEASSFRHAQAVARAVQEVTGHVTVYSGLGKSGAIPSHFERDFHRRVAGSSALLDVRPWHVRVPVRIRRTGQIVMRWWPLLMPHVLFAAMFKSDTFGRVLPPGVMCPQVFWDQVRLEDWAQHHPAYQHDVRYMLPLRLHGDEGTMHGKKPGLVLQWQSLLQHGSCWDSRFLVAIVPTHQCVRQNKFNFTWQGIFEAIAWSFKCLLAGNDAIDNQPANLRRPKGRPPDPGPLAGVWRATCVGIKGDGKFLKEVFMPGRAYDRAFICRDCWASKVLARLIYTDVTLAAAWRLTRESNQQFMRHAARLGWSLLLELPGIHRDLIVDDLLHVLYLGVLRDATGTALRVLATARWFPTGADIDAQLLCAFGRYAKWCEDRGLADNADPAKWTEESIGFGPREFPTLSIKGAATKLLTAWLHVCQQPA